MTNEIKQAAERLRKVKDGKFKIPVLVEVYGDMTDDDLYERIDIDRWIISEAYLAQHPSDGDEAVTKLKSDPNTGTTIIHRDHERTIEMDGHTIWVVDEERDAVPVPLIRGYNIRQVKQLMIVLGITTTESE
jgi:hypothetical protein